MQNSHVKKGDEVVVISGADKGKRGKIIEVLRARQRVIVEGAHMINGAIIEREGTVHISNVMKAEVFDASTKRSKPEAAAAE